MMSADDGPFPRLLPVLKLQEETQQEIVMGSQDWRFPAGPSSTIQLPSCKSRETRGDYDGKQRIAISPGSPPMPCGFEAIRDTR